MTRARRPPAKRERDGDAPSAAPRGERPLPPGSTVLADVAIMVGAFVLATVAAELAGAANLGTSLSFGQIAFALAAVYVMLRR